jgi:hypothetical protein
MEQAASDRVLYQIRVKGVLDRQWVDWFEGAALSYKGDVTVIDCSVADQAALQGLLRQLYSLGLTLISVNPVEQQNSNPSQRQHRESPDTAAHKGDLDSA